MTAKASENKETLVAALKQLTAWEMREFGASVLHGMNEAVAGADREYTPDDFFFGIHQWVEGSEVVTTPSKATTPAKPNKAQPTPDDGGTLTKGYLTRDELAEALNMSARTLYRYSCQQNGLPFTMIGGRVHYRLSSVKKWLEGIEKTKNPSRRKRGA